MYVHLSTNPLSLLFVCSSKLEVTVARPNQLNPKPEVKDLVFGKSFTDHMLRVPWNSKDGWKEPRYVRTTTYCTLVTLFAL